MRRIFLLLAIALFNFGVCGQAVTQGSLFAVNKKGAELGACPLKSTNVRVDVSGFIARINVKQEFENSFAEAIEAVYTFPLSHGGAVDQITMTVGERVVRGKIMKREEARQVYETAKDAGQTASLLDQERPNIFTQAVANIMPGEKVTIDISYVETLKYDDGAYEFVFPMTIAPRYIPGSVSDAAKIAAPVVETRAGHDISIEVNINAGVPVEEIRSTSHVIQQLNISPSKAKITLRDEKVIPNKDFILRYDVSGKRNEDAVLAHRDERGGFFTLVLQPPDKFTSEDRTPKEIVFVLDTSGSMSGFPIEKAKEAMKLSLDGLYPEDTFNLITFAGDTHVLFEEPVPATQANLERAQAFLESRSGSGGTEMMKAIKASLDPSDSKEHLRIVCFMTDGVVGNDDEIVAEIKKHPRARIFSFGIGSSVNRSLLDRMAEAGNGEVEYVGLEDDGSKAAKRFYERVRTPLLTDLSIDWNGMPVADMHPNKLSDLFSAKPVIVNGRYSKAASGTIKLKGKVAGQDYSRDIAISLPEAETANDVLATLWARRRVDEISNEVLTGKNVVELNKQITNIGLDFGIMTSFTSFVAVEDRIVNQNGKPITKTVPVETPEGTKKALAKAYKRWLDNDVAYLITTEEKKQLHGGGGGGAQQTVNVMASQVTIVTKSGDVSNGKTKSAKRGPARKSTNSGSDTGYGSGSGSGSGRGTGTGSGNGTGPVSTSAGSPPPPAKSQGVFSNLQTIANLQRPPASTEGDVAYPKTETLPLTTEQLREQRLKAKLHSWIYSFTKRTRMSVNDLTPNEAKFVRDGKAEIKIVLTAKTPEALEKLKALGFEVDSTKDGPNISGRIPIDKVSALAELEFVKLVLPWIR